MSGSTNIVKGRIKEAFGSLTGNAKLREAGKAEREKGQAQRATAAAAKQVKGTVRKTGRKSLQAGGNVLNAAHDSNETLRD